LFRLAAAVFATLKSTRLLTLPGFVARARRPSIFTNGVVSGTRFALRGLTVRSSTLIPPSLHLATIRRRCSFVYLSHFIAAW
jgi:hypothetical protein